MAQIYLRANLFAQIRKEKSRKKKKSQRKRYNRRHMRLHG